jgi:hypothetical protein
MRLLAQGVYQRFQLLHAADLGGETLDLQDEGNGIALSDAIAWR